MEQNPTNTPPEMQVKLQTEELPVKEGMYVEKGQTVFQIYNTDNCWVLLSLFADQASLIKVGMPVTITPETAPDKEFQGKIGFIEPFYRSGSKNIIIRILFNNTKAQIPIGSQVKAKMRINSNEVTWLPRDAVLSLGLNSIVLVKQGEGFKVHPVQTGITVGNEIQILSGLGTTDSVASNAQFLMDSESFIKTK
jgi:Cu(I)/Ag(I) efflux system membrane fusion protein